MSVTFNGYPTIQYLRYPNDQDQLVLGCTRPRQLTKYVPTLKVILINNSKK
jgi:hypothetical protein